MLSRPLIDRIACFGISWYAILIVFSIAIGYIISNKEAERMRLPKDTIIDFLLYAIPLGIIFARIYYVFFRFGYYKDDLMSIFDIRGGGLAIYGGIIGGLIAAKIVCKKKCISTWALLDAVAPSVVLAQAIGRWGNYINMEAYGLRINEPFLQFFPFAVEIPVGDIWYWHMATFFYEFCWDVLVFAALQVVKFRKRKDGDVFRWYILLYCAGRTVIEGVRNDSLTFISEFVRISQVLSAIMVLVIGIYYFIQLKDRISAITILPILCNGIAIVSVFLGEFERGAYSFLFSYSQSILFVTLIACLLIVVVWYMDSKTLTLRILVPYFTMALITGAVFVSGIGRANLDNTYYITIRQCTVMLQMILNTWLLYYSFIPNKAIRK